jgi:hypothetical protein
MIFTMRLPHALLAALFLAATALAQTSLQRGRIPPNLRDPARLNPAEGARILQDFRQVRLAGDFLFAVELIHQPHRGESIVYRGHLSGQAAGDLRTRVDLAPTTVDAAPCRFLQWSGPEPRLWKVSGEQSDPRPIEGEALLEPLLPGLTYTPFDLQMPFVHWGDFVYEGAGRLKGRPVHYFLLYPPPDDDRYASIGAVRIVVDADFNVAMRAETLDAEGTAVRRLEVSALKKVDEQWIVRRFDLVDLVSRDRTVLLITAARVGLDLPPVLFTPEGLDKALPPVPLTEL